MRGKAERERTRCLDRVPGGTQDPLKPLVLLITLFISGFLRDAQNASRHLTTAPGAPEGTWRAAAAARSTRQALQDQPQAQCGCFCPAAAYSGVACVSAGVPSCRATKAALAARATSKRRRPSRSRATLVQAQRLGPQQRRPLQRLRRPTPRSRRSRRQQRQRSPRRRRAGQQQGPASGRSASSWTSRREHAAPRTNGRGAGKGACMWTGRGRMGGQSTVPSC